jgi:hypothetical protein
MCKSFDLRPDAIVLSRKKRTNHGYRQQQELVPGLITGAGPLQCGPRAGKLAQAVACITARRSEVPLRFFSRAMHCIIRMHKLWRLNME